MGRVVSRWVVLVAPVPSLLGGESPGLAARLPPGDRDPSQKGRTRNPGSLGTDSKTRTTRSQRSLYFPPRVTTTPTRSGPSRVKKSLSIIYKIRDRFVRFGGDSGVETVTLQSRRCLPCPWSLEPTRGPRELNTCELKVY